MTDADSARFTNNQAAEANPDRYMGIEVDVARVVESWRSSLFSFEWLTPEGAIKPLEALKETEQAKRRTVEDRLKSGEALQRPILGIGIEDNVEIGSGRAEFLTLAALGRAVIPVHIPKSNEKDFKPFIAGPQAKGERGNALFYILIAVALLAALSMAVSSGMRGGPSDLEEDRAQIIAGELIEYSGIMANAVAQLRLRGVGEDQLCFDSDSWGHTDYDHSGCTDDSHKIFHPSGSGLIWSQAQSLAMDTNASPDNFWHIYSDNEIDGVGTTCGSAACAELLLVVDELSRAVCTQINELLEVNNPSDEPPVDDDMGEAFYAGAFGYAQTIGDEAASADLSGRLSGCFQRDSNSEYVFYKVLIAR